MRYARFIALAVMAGALGFTVVPADAQGRQSTVIPAEFPPASYSARQYVDSRGCVYVRAGIDGNTDWVPRVNRAREHLCGAQPTTAAPAPAPAPQPRSAPPVVQITPDAAPAPAPRTTTTRAPAATAAPTRTVRAVPQPVVRAAPAPVVRAAPQRVVRAAPAPRVSPPSARRQAEAPPAAVQQAARQACRGASSVSARYIHDGSQYSVRCGPQSAPHVTIVRRGEAPSAGKNVYRLQAQNTASGTYGTTRIVPRHVYEGRDEQVVKVPRGYRSAFDDDRLNRKRANQSVDGYRATQLVWTNTVPRRLVDRRTGRDVTVKYPKLIYPYTDYATQNAALSSKRQAAQRVATPARVPTMSTPRKPAAAAMGRYVQVATFGVPANAERTARRLQGMGLPVRYGTYTRGGKSYRTVLAGPFASQNDLNRALSTARRAGFGDAFVR